MEESEGRHFVIGLRVTLRTLQSFGAQSGTCTIPCAESLPSDETGHGFGTLGEWTVSYAGEAIRMHYGIQIALDFAHGSGF